MTNATTTEFSRRCRHCGEPLDPASSFCSKCGATAEAPGTSGDPLRDSLQALFGRELEIQDELGRGGMAAVYAAFDPALQRRVAVKVLLPEMAEETGMSNKFLQEARTVASLQHPHVVTVYGVKANDTAQAIVMQFVEGRSLDTVLKGKSRLPIPVAGLILAQAASGLQHAHDRGIVHRDVKPANVLLDHDGRAIVSDFGIARRETAPRTTATGFVIGTWSYMSPEQRSALAVGPATDQYAFGIMAFEILTGELPFKGNVQEVLHAHMVEPPPSLRERRPEISPSIEALVHRMLAKQPNERYSSMRDAQRAFRALVPDEGGTTQVIAGYSHVQKATGSVVIAAPKIPNVPGLERNSLTASSAPTVPSRSVAPAAPAAASSRSAWIAAAAAVILLAGLGIVWKMKNGASSSAPLAQTTAQPALSTPVGQPAGQPIGSTPTQTAATSTSPNHADKQPVANTPTGSGAAANPVAAAQGNAGSATIAAPAPVVTSPPRADSSAVRATPNMAPAPDAASSVPSAAITDARKIGRDFVTLLNQHRFRELAQLPARGGDAALRAELVRLTQNAPDFEAGFDRVASAPERTSDGFVTDFILDLQWKGGQKQMLIQSYAVMQSGTWHLAGFGVESPR